ncbi:MAG: hypothetical protein PHG82_04960 [Candidatus Gracilibacteria bacterium]|nr:hypothetical protein [Candidatus Gracilibacteria bacterium]
MTETQNTNRINVESLVKKELDSFNRELENLTRENLEYILSILRNGQSNPTIFCKKYNKKNIPINQMMIKVVSALSKYNKQVDAVLDKKRS